MIFRQGDSGTDLFIVTRGTASAYIHQPTGRDIRLVTFAPGAVFGELAILDAGPRSASIIADDDFVSYALSQAQFAVLSRGGSRDRYRAARELGSRAEWTVASRRLDDQRASNVSTPKGVKRYFRFRI